MSHMTPVSVLALVFVAVAVPVQFAVAADYTIRRSITVKAPPERVASILENPELFASWNPLLTETKPRTYLGRGPDSTLDWTAKLLGVTLAGKSVTTKWKPRETYAWRSTESLSGLSLEGQFVLEPAARETPGGTLLTANLAFTIPDTLEPVVKIPGVQRLLDDAVGRALANIAEMASKEPPPRQ